MELDHVQATRHQLLEVLCANGVILARKKREEKGMEAKGRELLEVLTALF